MSWTSGNTITANRLEDKADRDCSNGYPQLGTDALIPFNLLPIGSIALYGGVTAPTGWILCDGSAINRTTFAALFALISTSYGAGDGSLTFNVPDFRSRTIVGAGSGSGLTARTRGQIGGEETHILTEAEMAAHTHTDGVTLAGAFSTESGGDVHPTAQNTGSVGSGNAHENMCPYGVATYIIKASLLPRFKNDYTTVAGSWAAGVNPSQTDWDSILVSSAGYINNYPGSDLNEIKWSNITLNTEVYNISIGSKKNPSHGIVELLHGTTSIGTSDRWIANGDLYNQTITFIYTPTIKTTADLRFRVNGKNTSSTGYTITFSRLEIYKI